LPKVSLYWVKIPNIEYLGLSRERTSFAGLSYVNETKERFY